jgi:hypothetical protein
MVSIEIVLIGIIITFTVVLLIEVHKQIQPTRYKQSNRRQRQALGFRPIVDS